jgi:hypothetical protein
MNVTAKGRINVTTPGTPVPLSTDNAVTACKLFFQVVPGLTGKTYVGVPGMNKSTLEGVLRILWPNSAGGFSETFSLESQGDHDSIRVANYVVDADVAGEGLLVSYWTE